MLPVEQIWKRRIHCEKKPNSSKAMVVLLKNDSLVQPPDQFSHGGGGRGGGRTWRAIGPLPVFSAGSHNLSSSGVGRDVHLLTLSIQHLLFQSQQRMINRELQYPCPKYQHGD